jgi:restriction system protein
LEREFVSDGGYTERLAAARIAHRSQSVPAAASNQPAPQAPHCPLCAKPMALRTAHKGPHAGSQFWGCTAYPGCKGLRPLD